MAEPGSPPVIGIIGGSGIYEIEGLQNAEWRRLRSSFGAPSDALLFGELNGQRLVFLPRHGRGHRIPPSGLNFRANIDAMKRAGVTEILSLSAVGSLREDLPPGSFVIVDQFIDRTFAREKSFFGPLGLPARRAGTYIVMEGPQFSTRAESKLYRAWGCDVIGMTNMPEAKLAREAEICYATVAMVTDYDCWHDEHDHVTVDQVVKTLLDNADKARALIKQVVPKLSERMEACEKGCHHALDAALITHGDARDPEVLGRLDAVAGRVLGD